MCPFAADEAQTLILKKARPASGGISAGDMVLSTAAMQGKAGTGIRISVHIVPNVLINHFSAPQFNHLI